MAESGQIVIFISVFMIFLYKEDRKTLKIIEILANPSCITVITTLKSATSTHCYVPRVPSHRERHGPPVFYSTCLVMLLLFTV